MFKIRLVSDFCNKLHQLFFGWILLSLHVGQQGFVGYRQQLLKRLLLSGRQAGVAPVEKVLEHYIQLQQPAAATPAEPVISTRVLCASARLRVNQIARKRARLASLSLWERE